MKSSLGYDRAVTYHHGDLRRELLVQAAEAIAEDSVAGLSMRALAKRAGVSNAAPTYHFGDKAGLLTALATEGFDLLAGALGDVDDGQTNKSGPAAGGQGLLARGVAYVEFALGYPSHFAVMFEPRLLHDDDAELAAARQRAWAALSDGVVRARSGMDSDFEVAAWSLVHGYATLVLSGALEPQDALTQARNAAAHLVVDSDAAP